MGIVDALLLSQCDVLVGKFTSGLFRAAYQLAAAQARRAAPTAPLSATYDPPPPRRAARHAAPVRLARRAVVRRLRRRLRLQ